MFAVLVNMLPLVLIGVALLLILYYILFISSQSSVHVIYGEKPDDFTVSIQKPPINRSLTTLLLSEMLTSQGIKLKWIGQRIERYSILYYFFKVNYRLAVSWDKAAQALSGAHPELFLKQQKILLFPGLVCL